MNLTMQQPITYPFYIGSPRLPFSVPWSSNPFHFPTPSYQNPPSLSPISYPLPFILSHQPRQNLPPKPLHSFSSYTNTRYNHLKQSTNHINRHRSIDTSLHSQRYTIPNYQYRPLKTKSVSDFQQLYHQNSTHLIKAHSWHAINHLNQPNLSVNYIKETPLSPEKHHHHHHHHHRQRSPKKKKKSHGRQLSSSSSSKQISEPDIIRISTLDEIPIINNPIFKENLSNSNKNKKIKQPTYINSNKRSSPSSTTSSHSSFQKRLNGSLRDDPLLIAAMEDFRQLRRTTSRSTTLTPHQRDLSRDSLCSNSTDCSSSSSISRSHSQSSFTSLERLEIRHLIKILKTKSLQTEIIPFQLPSIPPSSSEPCSIKKPSLISINKPKKSSITEELDQKFNKLRSNNPNQDIIYVKPSLLHQEKPSISTTSTELLDKVEIQKIDENPIISIPVPRNSPIPSSEVLSNEENILEIKPEYAIPIKKLSEVNLRSIKKSDQIRSFSFCKPINDIVYETRPLSMFSWLQCGLTNPFPTKFQSIENENENEYDKSLVKENIYASDIDIHIPLSNEKTYFNNQILIKDYLSNYKQSKKNSSILNDCSRLFTRFGNNKHEEKKKLKTKLTKNNQNLRCSIM